MRNLRNFLLAGTAIYSFLLAGLLLQVLADAAEWGYEGETGPDNWGELSPDFALCADGTAQSPIDIRDASELTLVDIEFHYGEAEADAQSSDAISNNGHTIQVDTAPGRSIVYNGIRYDLLQFHFHAPSEHTIQGAAPMEVHFVHRDANSGNLAVVGILLTEGDGDNEAYGAVLEDMPAEAGDPAALPAPLAMQTLLPEGRGYYTYQGSLTTPPCSEIVRWLLLDTPIALSAGQIAAYTTLYSNNARPVQPLGKRDLLYDAKA